MEETLLKRILPHSIEAEQSVIGSMLMDKDAVIVALDMISAEDFYSKQYAILYETMLELFNEGKEMDLVVIQDRLREKNVAPELSSLEFIKEIITTVPTSANIKYYATIVKEKSTLRKLIKLNEDIANSCYAGSDSLEDILARTEKDIFELLQSRTAKDCLEN